jgi:hypothetical protein
MSQSTTSAERQPYGVHSFHPLWAWSEPAGLFTQDSFRCGHVPAHPRPLAHRPTTARHPAYSFIASSSQEPRGKMMTSKPCSDQTMLGTFSPCQISRPRAGQVGCAAAPAHADRRRGCLLRRQRVERRPVVDDPWTASKTLSRSGPFCTCSRPRLRTTVSRRSRTASARSSLDDTTVSNMRLHYYPPAEKKHSARIRAIGVPCSELWPCRMKHRHP